MNHSLMTADRNTHVRIVAVSLACAIVFVVAMIGARVSEMDGRTAYTPTVLKAGVPVGVSGHEGDIRIR